MNFFSFQQSLAEEVPPAGVSIYLQALWYDAQGNWQKAHELIQDLPDAKAAWIHAYLHRKEGDSWNAGYWYRKASREVPTLSLDDEWAQITKALL